MELEQKQEQGSFPSGLVVGFLAGAVGYFISQTKEGKQMREKFISHWQELRETLIAEGKLPQDECDLTDYIKATRSKINEFLGHIGQDFESEKKAEKKKTAKRKKRLFQGI